MSEFEDRLRAELWAHAQRTQREDLRELHVPSGGGAPRRRRLAPAVAALAVAAVVGAVAGVRLTADHQPPPAAPRVTPLAGRPPFYVTVPYSGNSGHPDATVRATATGAILGRVRLPGTHVSYVTAAADDRTFVLAADRHGSSRTEFYRLTLTASGRPGPLTRLPVTIAPGQFRDDLGGLALSADGATLALAVVPTTSPPAAPFPAARIEVVSLRTGATRTWTAPGWTAVQSLSWGRGGTLAFLAPDPRTASGGFELRVLDTTRSAGRRLTGTSRPVPLSGVTDGALQSALVTDGGRTVVAWTRAPAPGAGQVGDSVLAEFSARTGRRLRVLDTLPSRGAFTSYAVVTSAGPSGQDVLAAGSAVSGQVTAGGVVLKATYHVILHRIDRGQVTALPDPGNLLLDAAW
jgi:hypothetical protein